jgi:hypothetical protein
MEVGLLPVLALIALLFGFLLAEGLRALKSILEKRRDRRLRSAVEATKV